MESASSSQGRASVDEVLAEFDGKQELYTTLCAKTKGLIEVCLQEAGIKYQSVQSRVKTRQKLSSKYLDPEKEYRSLVDIHDLAGLRVITYYEDDIDRVAELIRSEFAIDEKNSVDKRKTEPDRFGYRAVNLVGTHTAKRVADVEYKRFSGMLCEIQITSVLSHAWSEIEHEWYDLKASYPDDIKRRFSRLVALFEIADSEFLEIRKARSQYERAVTLRVEANVPNIAIDAVSLRAFIEKDPIVNEVDMILAQVMGVTLSEDLPDHVVERRVQAALHAEFLTLEDLRNSLKKYGAPLVDFVNRSIQELWKEEKPSVVRRGVSIFHLSSLLTSSRGRESAVAFFKKYEFSPSWAIDRQVQIAREVLKND